MRSRTLGTLASSILAVTLAWGCRDAHLLEPTPGVDAPAPSAHVIIQGPQLVEPPGSFQWRAETSVDEPGLTYEWLVERIDDGTALAESRDATVELSLEEGFRGALRIGLVVTRGSERMLAETFVMACPGDPRRDWCGEDF